MKNQINKDREQFLIKRFKEEWLETEKIKNREEFLKKLKYVGIKSGKILLGLAAVVGVLTIAAVAPNMLVAFGRFNKQSKKFFNKKDLENNLSTYRKNYYIKFKKEGDVYKIELTSKGKRAFLKSLANDLRIKERDRWDGKWWLVTFDIPRKHNASRNYFREKLKMIGMKRLQDSVFVSRHDCREEVLFWASLYNLIDFVHIAKAEFLTDINF